MENAQAVKNTLKESVGALETILADIIESKTLLEKIYRDSDGEDHVTDCAIACLIRSLDVTIEKGNGYVNSFLPAHTQKPERDIDLENDVFDALLAIEKVEKVTRDAGERFYTDKDDDNIASTYTWIANDYATQTYDILKRIESKLESRIN